MHLIDWPAAFLARSGIELEPVPVDVDRAWAAHANRIQQLMDTEPDRILSGAPMGPTPLAQLLDQIYVGDIFLHTWDLARASGQEPPLDEETCAAMLAGMAPIEDVMRGSGQYGARVPVSADRSAMDQLMGFIGRDPDWAA
jgi:hypothetical protein